MSSEPVVRVPNPYRTPALDERGVLADDELEAEDLITVAEAVAILGITRARLYRLRRDSRLSAWPAQCSLNGTPTDYRFLREEVTARASMTERGKRVEALRVASSSPILPGVRQVAGLDEVEFLRRENAQLDIALERAKYSLELEQLRGEIAGLRTELAHTERRAAEAEAMLGALYAARQSIPSGES